LACALVVTLAPMAQVAPSRHPQYGGTLRVEIDATVISLDPPTAPLSPSGALLQAEAVAAKREIESLLYEKVNEDGTVPNASAAGAFRISEWQPGKHLTLVANENFAGGRPFVDSVEIEMGRAARDRRVDLALARTDLAEIPPEEARQASSRGIRMTASQPDQLIALTFTDGTGAVQDVRAREALADSIDRATMVEFILQKDGEAAGGLLPQWASGTAFLFSTAADPVHAKELRAQIGTSPQIRLGYDSGDALEESIAERIVVDARESGISLTAGTIPPDRFVGPNQNARLIRLAMPSAHAGAALVSLAPTLELVAKAGLAVPSDPDAEQIFAVQQAALAGFRLVPLVWVPRVYGVSERVRDWQAPATGERWPLADVWLDAASGVAGTPEPGAPKEK
jgi:ABC-type transport system substrate-binding protein